MYVYIHIYGGLLWYIYIYMQLIFIYDNTHLGITKIAEGCPNLLNLALKSNDDITDVSIVRIAEMCPLLQSLDLKDCLNLTDICVVRLAERCHDLDTLILGNSVEYNLNITDLSISMLAEGCPTLHTLNLQYCHYITDSCVISLAEVCMFIYA
jgi:F-box/leucine-rich repeat protein 2/20